MGLLVMAPRERSCGGGMTWHSPTSRRVSTMNHIFRSLLFAALAVPLVASSAPLPQSASGSTSPAAQAQAESSNQSGEMGSGTTSKGKNKSVAENTRRMKRVRPVPLPAANTNPALAAGHQEARAADPDRLIPNSSPGIALASGPHTFESRLLENSVLCCQRNRQSSFTQLPPEIDLDDSAQGTHRGAVGPAVEGVFQILSNSIDGKENKSNHKRGGRREKSEGLDHRQRDQNTIHLYKKSRVVVILPGQRRVFNPLAAALDVGEFP